jgi:arachidonate 15-lipoxygenase
LSGLNFSNPSHIKKMPQPSLPQDDLDPTKRFEGINLQRQDYQYDPDYLRPLVLMKEVPVQENFSGQYIAERTVATAVLIPNMLAAKTRSFFDHLDDLQDYEDLFNLLPLPEVAKSYQTNDSFAEQRLSGANPLIICQLDKNDPRAEILKGLLSFKPEFEPLFDIPKELGKGNIYVADYTGKDSSYIGPSSVEGGSYVDSRKYLPKPLAFFWWKSIGISDRGKLVPIAIELPKFSGGSTLYSPFEEEPLDWLFAKLCVQIADGNHHEMSTHLCRTHFVMAPIAIATAHQLAINHPLSILLKPHFMFMLTNNDLGKKILISDNGSVDQVLAGTLPESLQIVKDAYEGWNIKEFAFPKEISNRKMDKIPHYPYRDDGMLVWDALHTFVTNYLNHFYPTPQQIADDTELQAWAKELSDKTDGGAKVKGMPSKIKTVSELIEIVTTTIFICGPQHSAVNYAQYEYMAFAANMPLSAYLDPTKYEKGGDDPMGKILNLLPPFEKAASQLQTLFVLSAYRYDRLGYYEKAFKDLYGEDVEEIFNDNGTQKNQKVADFIKQFQQDLNVVENEIDANNQKRAVPYPYLKPSLILNSISI